MPRTNEPRRTETTPTKRRFGQRKHVVLAGLALSIAALILISQTWITVGAPDTGVAVASLVVAGGTASPAAVALAVVMLAATIALTIAGPITRWVITVVQALAGAGIAGVSIWSALSPQEAAATKVGETFGLGIVSSNYDVTIFPFITAVLGVLMVLVAVWGSLVAAPAASKSSKYDRAGSARRRSKRDAGKRASASGGETTQAGKNAEDEPGETNQDETDLDEIELDEIDQWDALTQGEDPTDPDGPNTARARFY